MKISAKVGLWMCAAFALVCCGFALNGFSALTSITDEAERDLSLGYSWFWMFLAAVAAVFGVLCWMIKEGRFGELE